MLKAYKNGELIGTVGGVPYTKPEEKPLTEQEEAIAELGIVTMQEIEEIKGRLAELERLLQQSGG